MEATGVGGEVGGLMDCVLSPPGPICVADETPSLFTAPRLGRRHPLSLLIPAALLLLAL